MNLIEKKDTLPTDIMTSYVSRGWEEIGTLKASIDGFKKDFTNATDFIDILQDLLDSYLICVGRMEKMLNSKKHLDIPDSVKITENFDNSVEEFEEEEIEECGQAKTAKNVIEEEVPLEDIDAESEDCDEFGDTKLTESFSKNKKSKSTSEPFEYFVDFEEPELNFGEPSMHDAWLNK